MLQCNDNKCSNKTIDRQIVNTADNIVKSSDAVLQYPFVEKSDYKAMIGKFDKYVAKWNLQADIWNKNIKDGVVTGVKNKPHIWAQHRRTFEGLLNIFSATLTREAEKHNQTKSINNPFGLASHIDSMQVNLTGFAHRRHWIEKELVRVQQITRETVTSHLRRLDECGLIEHTAGGKWQNAKVSIFPKFLQISDRDRETKEKTQTLRFQGCQHEQFGVFRIYNSININKKEVKAFKGFLQKSKNEIIAIAQTPAVGFTGTLGQGDNSFEKSTPKNQTRGAENYNVAGVFARLGKKYSSSDSTPPKAQVKQKKHYPLSQVLIAWIGLSNYMEFDNELVNGKFYKYKPIHIGDLERELLYGSLSRAELKKVLIRDFTMYASRLWVGKSVKYGTWVNTMYQIALYFGDNTNIMSKEQLVNKALELRKQLELVIVSFNNGTFTPFWYPSLYFNHSQSIGGFKQAKKLLIKKEKAVAKRKDISKRLTPNKNLFKYPENVFIKAIHKYEGNDINYQTTDKLRDKIYGYVHGGNLPSEYKTKIETYINRVESAD